MPTNPSASTLPLRLMLRFAQPAFERQFARHYQTFYHRYAQAALLLGLLLIVGDFLVDWIAYPGVAANWLRLQLAVPMVLAGLAYTFLPQALRHWQAVLAGFIVALSVALFWILLRIDAEGGQGLTSWVGILNFTFLAFYCFVVLGLQFRFALWAGLAILAAFCATLWWHPAQSPAELAYWAYHTVTLFLLAVGVGWWREFILRTQFASLHELERARAAAEQLGRAKSDFLATMSHEIRTPLNGVLGMNELLMGSTLSREQQAWAQAAQVSGRHLLALLNDVLDASKVEARQLRLEAIAFDLGHLVEDTRTMLQQAAQAKGLTLQTRVMASPQGLRLVGDPLRLRQVLTNLVGNAIKFTQQGSVQIQVRVDGAGAGRARVRIAVQDTGTGIAASARERIFERFAQADGSTTRQFGGTGLGLAICRELVTLMGGEMGVDSDPGQGSCFWLEIGLPFAPAAATPVAASAPARPPARLRGKVLLAEDNPINQAVAGAMLHKLGLAWRLAADGQAAVDAVREETFDAVLMDCQMPVMDGWDATRAIRALPDGRGARLPIVAQTANSSSDDDARCRAAGMDGFLPKPFDMAALAAALAPWLAVPDED